METTTYKTESYIQSKLTKEEHETHLYIDEIDGKWTADSSILKDIHKFQKQGWECVEKQLYPDGSIMAAKFKARRGAITIGRAEKRKLSDEKRAAISERARKMRMAKTS